MTVHDEQPAPRRPTGDIGQGHRDYPQYEPDPGALADEVLERLRAGSSPQSDDERAGDVVGEVLRRRGR